MRKVYLDHSATTPVRREVAEKMWTYLTDKWGNPSSIHGVGREAKKGIEKAREKIAALLGAEAREIVFTGGGTEADNHAIIGTAAALGGRKGRHIITSSIEHHAVLDTCEYLEKDGFEVTYLPVTREGVVRIEDLKSALRKDTILVSIMHANNEVGTIQPVEDIGRICKERGILFHIDAVQSFGKIPVDVQDLNVDLLSISAHKIYGPKGIGCLYIRRGVKIDNFAHGGAQERGRRPGTENVAGIVGFAKAAELAVAEMETEAARQEKLRDKLIKGLQERLEDVELNGHPGHLRLCNNVNMSFKYVEGESLLLSLDMSGVAASSGSACSSGSLDPSHVLTAMGLPLEYALGSVRMTLGRDNTEEDVDYVLDVLPDIVKRLRNMSPFYKTQAMV
ncbi:MAG: cysteine desulfurase NifS [Clostridia bacterium]|nr:cysteine desulfurase NifS [Clostridia bacterium]